MRRRAGRARCRAPASRARRQCRTSRRATRRVASSAQRRRAVGAEQQQAAPRHQVHQPPERERHGVEVGVDVGVVELDVVDDGDVGQVLEELRGLVEERAVVLVAFDHEVAPLPEPIARAARRRNCARCRRRARSDRARRASAASRSATSSWSCRACRRSRSSGRPTGSARGSLPAASSSGSCDRAPLRARRCRARSRCRRRPDRVSAVMCSARVAAERRDAFGGEEVAHRRIDVLIGAAHVVALALEHRRQRRHRRAADANQMDALQSLDRRFLDDQARPRRRRRRGTRRRTAASSPAPTVWPDGNPISTGPGKIARTDRAIDRARRWLARRLVAPRQLADHDAPTPARADRSAATA